MDNSILMPMSANEIAYNFETLDFKYLDVFQQLDHPFFKEFAKRFNEDPILLKCVCENKRLFSQCILNLPYRWKLGNAQKHLDNRIIKGLIKNKFLNAEPSPIREFSNNADWEHFEKIDIERVSPFLFDGKLVELYAKGGLFFESRSDKTLQDIVTLARAFSDLIIEGRFSSFAIYQIQEGWSAYHGNMGYDNTFILFDKDQGEFWILANTEYD